ncbi:hypothetical protein [Burkholderia glumae]|uniref:hypothetical protein n=1 Tax=Burkholderia glumae TaxID=337 RepID=UPI0021516BC4|nr:hypothetical protein [Burkholderia glumae]
MPRNGSGQYTLPAGNPVVTNTIISSSGWANPTLSDIAAAITDSIAADGQTTPTANLPMGGFRHTGASAGVSSGDYTTIGQLGGSGASQGVALVGTPDGNTMAQLLSLGLNRVVDSIASIRALSKLIYQRAFATGYYAAHDGGGGAYQLDTADTTSTDNGGTIIVASDGGRWKLQHTGAVSIRQFGAKGQVGVDDTTAIQKCLNCGLSQWYVPEGTFYFTALTIPQIVGFCFFGEGPTSKLMQTGGGISFPTLASNCFDSHGTIRDLAFDGTSGTGNTLDTTYTQTLDLLNLTFNNVPVGLTSLKLDGNPNGGGTYMHDVRVKNLRIYSTTSGNAGVAIGAWASDSSIDGFIMNGGFTTNYCIVVVANGQTFKISNSHPYNALKNVVFASGNNGNFQWDLCTFDNAKQDIFYQTGSVNGIFTNCFFEAVNAGWHGIVFDNSYNNIMVNTSFTSPFGVATACVQEVNGSSGNKIIGGTIDNTANWTSLFNLAGNGSFAKGFQQYGNYDTVYNLSGVAQSPQAQNTIIQYGANGAAAIGNTAWCTPLDGRILFAVVFVDNTPAAGQNFTFNLQVNGSTIATGVINNGFFGVKISPSPQFAVFAGDQISIRSVFSASSGSASPRYSVTCVG